MITSLVKKTRLVAKIPLEIIISDFLKKKRRKYLLTVQNLKKGNIGRTRLKWYAFLIFFLSTKKFLTEIIDINLILNPKSL